MKKSLCAIVVLIATGCAIPSQKSTGANKPPYEFTDQKNSELAAIVSIAHPTLPTEKEYVFYFKCDVDPEILTLAGGSYSSIHGVDSRGNHFAASLDINPTLKRDVLEVEFSWSYDSGVEEYSDRILFSTPLGQTLNGNQKKIQYRIKWKTEPNHELQTTTRSFQ
jgi:hypothetical protein